MVLKDYFSVQADEYARRRPHYPPELFEYLTSVVSSHECAWDCGTGSGQAAIGLAEHFDNVIATDPSEGQLSNAFQHRNVTYKQASAEDSGIDSGSIDLVTVAQAIHWFDIDLFFAEVKRVLKPGGVISVWAYSLCRVTPELDTISSDFYYNVVGPYWPRERKYVDDQYKTLVFPFDEIQPPEFRITLDWDLHDLIAYIQTWSPVRRYMDANNADPTEQIAASLAEAWGDPQEHRQVVFPMYMRIGRKSQESALQANGHDRPEQSNSHKRKVAL